MSTPADPSVLPLSNREVRELKARSQRLDPHLKLGKAGMSDGFLRSLDELLTQHELVKVKFADFKEEKKEMSPEMAKRTGSHLLWRVGNVAVLYRKRPVPQAQASAAP